MEFKDKLKILRKERQISQQQLADAIFVSRSAVAKWENGLGVPSESSYNALLSFFGITDEVLPLNNEVEIITVTKNKKIHTLSAIIIAIAVLFTALLIIIVMVYRLSPQGKLKTYDWNKVDALLADMSKENNIYFPDGTIALEGDMLEIYYNKDSEAETFVRLTKIHSDSEDDYYKLLFDKHFYNMVEGKIVTVSYSCSFHYQDDVAYNLELAKISYFIGNTESFDALRQCTTYQITDKKIENGQFISCNLEPISTFGDEFSFNPEFHLPNGDKKYIEELMNFGFEKTTRFFEENELKPPY